MYNNDKVQNMDGYIARKVIKETENAYLVEAVTNRRNESYIIYKWVAKSICKPVEYPSTEVYVPEYIIDDRI